MRMANKVKLPPDVAEFFRQQGSLGGKVGGSKAAANMYNHASYCMW